MVRRLGAGPQVMWIHGLGESSLCFREVVGRLTDYHHWLCDLPGYGRSPWGESLTLSAIAVRLACLLEQVGPAVVIGHSMGGVVGTILAELRPDLVSALVNVDGNISLGDCGYSRPISEQSGPDFVSSGYEELLNRLAKRGQNDPAHRGYFVSMSLAQPSAVYRHSQELVELSTGEQLARRLARLTRPHLYIAGSPEGAAPRSLELLKEAGVPLVRIGDSGHWPFVDQPALFARAVDRFIAACETESFPRR